MEKVLSIIIPHYNSPEKLERLLGTIPEREEVEIIVSDDKSTKDIEKYNEVVEKHHSVTFLLAEKNTGAGGARNRGLAVATGKWVLFADSDDYFSENMWEAVSKYFDSSADVVLFPPTSVIEGTNTLADRHLTSEKIVKDLLNVGDEKSKLTARYMMVLNLSRMIRRSVIASNNIAFDESMRYFEDALFAMNTGKYAGEIVASDDVIYVITKAENTETYNTSEESDRLRKRCSYLRAKLLKETLSKSERKLLNAGNELVLRRWKEYKKNLWSRLVYGIYYRMFGTRLG